MKTKIAKAKKELFYRCQGRCEICIDEGGCGLEKDIKKVGHETIKKLVYNL